MFDNSAGTLEKTLYSESKLPLKIVGTYPKLYRHIVDFLSIFGQFFKPVFGDNTMADLNASFEAAVANSKNLSERPDNATMLKLYALYKQASSGDNADKKPGFSDMVGRAKWDAWNGMKGTGSDAAKQQYIDLVESLS